MSRYEWCMMRRDATEEGWDVDFSDTLDSLYVDDGDVAALLSVSSLCQLQLRNSAHRTHGPVHADVVPLTTGELWLSDLHASDWHLDRDFGIQAARLCVAKVPKKYRREFEQWRDRMFTGGPYPIAK